MNRLCICLLLPIACVISMPTQYVTTDGENHELPSEFWTHHFGPDFQHAIHLKLEHSDLIGDDNAIATDVPKTRDGNRKRSAYIIHKPNINKQDTQSIGNSMRVNLLQPEEIDALEKQMVNYAKENQMMESPVVVNLPASEASISKDSDQATPVVLNVPPVVYHSNPNVQHSHYLENTKSPWSYHNKYPLYKKLHMLYQNMMPTYDSNQYSYVQDMELSHKANSQLSNEKTIKNSSLEENRQTSSTEKVQPPSEQDAKDADQKAATTV